ncbi:putative glycine--tRNA ligase GRS1 [Microstroma glucosiphilum]|uniref:glycine--tRNA ligase n=1 Tax=Pseudomicrostroma glucosiphilum TaxID=1684307 RepID=A0A316UER5_9BASI|nr:putative glycine--tRNA ligase GRS1 [Pseudomicrostroma glucosiphilum]PWN23394.1 putative glycine--tRNA ligase GRS1 [Pseudomicrostroma glucosiphilum]
MSSSATPANVAVEVNRTAHAFSRAQLEGVMTKRFFYNQAFEIYGGVAGLYDYGPMGAALQANIISAWRNHFILEEEMLELDTTIMTPYDVLKTSGHVDKFADWMCKDTKTGEIFRADHLLEGVLEARLKGDEEARAAEGDATTQKQEVPAEKGDDKKVRKKKVKAQAVKLDPTVKAEYENILAQIDNYSGPELGAFMKKYDVRAPESGNEVGEPVQFNLMFETQIGPTGGLKGYLRPETAQGHFVNFSRLLEFNSGRVPFASAHIGKSFRNEISPRAGLLRVREFTMAEIEHFVDPLEKEHTRFDEVANVELAFLPKDVQQAGQTTLVTKTIGEAVSSGMVDNQTLGYFLARINLFLLKIGIEPSRLRFRQHMANEMAHYASDCWDAEIHTSYGWIECVGCADRSAYDLTVHAKKTKKDLVVQKVLKEPKVYEKWVANIDRKSLGPKFKKDAKAVEEAITALEQEQLESLSSALKNGPTKVPGTEYEISSDLVTVELKSIRETVREFTPNVIEPSFGLGRIFYALLEHSFWAREKDAGQGVLSLNPLVAPIKVLVVPISANASLAPLVKDISARLRKEGIASRVDDSSATIGRRYARNDELGTPFALTLDFASLQNGTMTLRERDTTGQLIGSIEDVVKTIKGLCEGSISWQDAEGTLKKYSGEQAL